ncbi:MAG: hypothetical protein R3228_19250, partial [Halioglobus sp.]|nr:hypothetical protein [Halioglobus sp.]
MSAGLLRPGISRGVYPQRLEASPGLLERTGRQWLDRAVAYSRRKYSLRRVAVRVDRAARGLDHVDDETLGTLLQGVRYELLREGLAELPVLRAFAMVREYAARTLGMRHYDEQLFGAWVIVNGAMAEMATGEGKSLTATLAAATAALAGIPVHVITTNEYLAQRDAREMRPLYEALGLSVVAVVESMNTPDKEAAYRSDIVYCTNKQVAFDYLRDRLISRNEAGPLSLRFSRAQLEHQLVLRGLCFAIIDESDSVLIDEARTPLILSREHEDPSQQAIVEQALAFARAMEDSRHYRLLPRENSVELTEQGRDWLSRQREGMEGVWAARRHTEFLVHQALCALHLYARDDHYLVREGKVEIIDRNTGRTMADRSWQRGLHQMIECKEGLDMTGYRETLASISYQRFFRRYLRLGGMSGTLEQVGGEMRSVYQQGVIAVPTHRPCLRRDQGF